MSASKKDYDPLSGLFGGGDPLPEPAVELPASSQDVPEPGHRALKAVSRPPRALEPPPASPAPAGPPAAAGPDPATLAKILAKAAAAKAGALARPAAPAPAAPAPAAPASAPSPTRAAAAPKIATRAPAPAKAAAAAAKSGGGRLAAMAPPAPKRALSAAEALEAARAAEAARLAAGGAPAAAAPAAPAAAGPAAAAPAASAPPGPAEPAGPGRLVSSRPDAAPVVEEIDDDALTDRAQTFVAAALPGAPLYVANAVRADERGTLRAVWKAHRARLLASSDFRTAFGAAAVVQAAAELPKGALVAALVVRDGGDLLVWFDLRSGTAIAAFEGGMAWGVAFG